MTRCAAALLLGLAAALAGCSALDPYPTQPRATRSLATAKIAVSPGGAARGWVG